MARAGELDRARRFLSRAQDELIERGERWPEPVILLAEAEVRAAEGADTAVVRDLLERSRDLATSQGTHAMARRMSRALSALDER